MAAELGKFISEQLKVLPKTHPARPFLVGMLQTTDAYLHKPNRDNIEPEFRTPDKTPLDPSDIFSTAKEGPYLSREKLLTLYRSPGGRKAVRDYADRALTDIEVHGDQSLAHILLPVRTWQRARGQGISTIDELKTAMQSSTIMRTDSHNRFSSTMYTLTEQRLAAFDQAIEEAL